MALLSGPADRVVTALTGGRVRSGPVRIDLSHPMVPRGIRSAVMFGRYERNEIELIRAHLKTEFDVVELGGSLGITGAHILSMLGPDRRLISVEANRSLIPVLRQALAEDRATVIHAAIDRAGSDTPFYDGPSPLWGGLNRAGGAHRQVRHATLRTIVAEHVDGPYTLVSDIEGAESSFLIDDPCSLGGCEQMIIELHNNRAAHVTKDELQSAAVRIGFHAVARSGNTVVFNRRR